MTINPHALVDDGVKNAKAFEKFQFERVGFFSVDPDSTNNHVITKKSILLRKISINSILVRIQSNRNIKRRQTSIINSLLLNPKNYLFVIVFCF